jgi:hypothetical protein
MGVADEYVSRPKPQALSSEQISVLTAAANLYLKRRIIFERNMQC